MLGVWSRSCLRPQFSTLAVRDGTFHFGSARNHHTLLTISLGLRNFRCKSEASIPSTSTTLKCWPTPRFTSTHTQKQSLLSRLLPAKIITKAPESASSVRKIVALAKPEWKPLTIAIGLLLTSSAVSMSVPFTIGKLIDFFSTENPVSIIFLAYWTQSYSYSLANTSWPFGLAGLCRPSPPFHPRSSGKRWSFHAYETFRLVSRLTLWGA